MQLDTPRAQATLSAWNVNTKVQPVVVRKTRIFGVSIVTEGGFVVCGASHMVCEKFTHKGNKPEYYVDLPLEDTEAFVIRVCSSSQSVTPKIFLKPTLQFTVFPLEFRNESRVTFLITL